MQTTKDCGYQSRRHRALCLMTILDQMDLLYFTNLPLSSCLHTIPWVMVSVAYWMSVCTHKISQLFVQFLLTFTLVIYLHKFFLRRMFIIIKCCAATLCSDVAYWLLVEVKRILKTVCLDKLSKMACICTLFFTSTYLYLPLPPHDDALIVPIILSAHCEQIGINVNITLRSSQLPGAFARHCCVSLDSVTE